MAATDREAREAEIAKAAYALLAEKGYGGMSMLAVARKARASNETLYKWYGDKTGLFRALITRNASEIVARLDEVIGLASDGKGTGVASLVAIGELLLGVLLSPRAIALNRAAAADASNSLGAVLADAGRGEVFPRIIAVFEGLVARDGAQARLSGNGDGGLRGEAAEVAALWLDLLVGDLQVRCVTGAMAPPDADSRRARALAARDRIVQLCGAT